MIKKYNKLETFGVWLINGVYDSRITNNDNFEDSLKNIIKYNASMPLIEVKYGTRKLKGFPGEFKIITEQINIDDLWISLGGITK